MSNPKQLLQELLSKGYAEPFAGKYVFTAKFFAALQETPEVPENLPVVAGNAPVLSSLSAQGWEQLFMKLIVQAQVPRLLEDNKGGQYYANKYSAPALKVFRKALEDGVQYEVLVKSVMLYYKSNVRYKKSLGNYFVQGDWKSDYEAMVEAAAGGADQLVNHIKQEVQSDNRSQYRLG